MLQHPPNLDSVVRTATNQSLTIWANGYGINRVGMPGKCTF